MTLTKNEPSKSQAVLSCTRHETKCHKHPTDPVRRSHCEGQTGERLGGDRLSSEHDPRRGIDAEVHVTRVDVIRHLTVESTVRVDGSYAGDEIS
jgi:hypothetical protein